MLLVPFIPMRRRRQCAGTLGITLVTFLITVAAYLNGYDLSLSGFQPAERVSWLPIWGSPGPLAPTACRCPVLASFITTLACPAAWAS